MLKTSTNQLQSRIPNNNRATNEPKFLNSKVRETFDHLKQAFIKASILHHFDLKRHIWIKINASGYAIGGILSQLALDNLGQ